MLGGFFPVYVNEHQGTGKIRDSFENKDREECLRSFPIFFEPLFVIAFRDI